MKNLDIVIEPRQKIGVCGRSGSGKSSTVMALFRMLELDQGSCILVDGLDLSLYSRAEIRSRLNAIPQDSVFIRGTIRENLDIDRGHSDAEVIDALAAVRLVELVQSLGGLGVSFEIDDALSHGQRQLFYLARALLREKSSIVVLDEATSSVDAESDAIMQQVIRKHFAECTIIAVAHRLSTILDFDKILLLDAGQVVEFDSPQALLGRDSKFRELYKILEPGA